MLNWRYNYIANLELSLVENKFDIGNMIMIGKTFTGNMVESYSNLQLNSYPNTQLDLFCSTISPFNAWLPVRD